MQQTTKFLTQQLCSIYEKQEALTIANMVIEHITGLKRIDRIIHKNVSLNTIQQNQLNTFTKELLSHKPVQYVLQEAWFAGMNFYVDEHVLIPRPETEELVELTIKTVEEKGAKHILDIGCGSGCISIALKKKIQEAFITAVDISTNALNIAKKNAEALETDINFLQIDFLNESQWKQLPAFDIIVSNPPYIKQSGINEMHRHVINYEPHLALFVPDEDALLFYKKMAIFGKIHLNSNGMIIAEINESLGNETKKLFEETGYKTTLIKDLQGKERIIKALS